MSRWLEMARAYGEYEMHPSANSAISAKTPPIGTKGANGTGERNHSVWVNATCSRCGGVLCPLVLVTADGRRFTVCGDCRQLREVRRA